MTSKKLNISGFAHHLLLALIIVLGVAGFGAYRIYSSSAASNQSQMPVERPNIVFVLTDDQDDRLTKFMPMTNKLIAGEGMSFDNYFDNISLCCAARASILRGQYAHNTKVEDNELPNGGFGQFYRLGEHNDNLPTWLNANGYDTSLMGKYINGYPDRDESGLSTPDTIVPQTWVPPGWTDWFSGVKGTPYKQYNYTMNDNGVLRQYGATAADYGVDVLSNRAAQYIRDHQSSDKPYFMYVAPYSPHSPSTPAPRYEGSEKGLKYPQSPAFNEKDVSDKPPFIRQRPELTDRNIERIDTIYQRRAEAMKGIDDLVANLYRTLEETGQLDTTYLVFTSDNGFHMGEHRLDNGKYTPYDTDIKLPLYIRGPGIAAGSSSDSSAGNIDLAPTFAAMAGATTPDFVDGRSLIPSLLGTKQTDRKYYLLERRPSKYMGIPEGKAIGSPNEPADESARSAEAYDAPPAYNGIRTNDGYVYIQYRSGVEEFYDLNEDKHQLNNLASDNARPAIRSRQLTVLRELRQQLPGLMACKATGCIK